MKPRIFDQLHCKAGEEPFTAPMIAVREELPSEKPCAVDILTVLTEERRRLSTNQLLDELESRDLLHGESTVKLALARMVADTKEIDNPKVNGRHVGYGLPGWDT
jgi:hypothetical protein